MTSRDDEARRLLPLDQLAVRLGMNRPRQSGNWCCPDGGHDEARQRRNPTLSLDPAAGWACHGARHQAETSSGGPADLIILCGGAGNVAEALTEYRTMAGVGAANGHKPKPAPAPKPEAAVRGPSRPLPGPPAARRWRYVDDLVVIRHDRPDGTKRISQWTADPDRPDYGWKGSPRTGSKGPHPLYGLTQLADQPTARVIIVEGEPSVEAAHQAGLGPSVTWAGGAGPKKWARSDWRPLRGRPVLLYPDDDRAPKGRPNQPGAGLATMESIGRHLATLGCEVSMVTPDGHGDGHDLVDHLQDGTARDRIAAAEPWTAPPEPAEGEPTRSPRSDTPGRAGHIAGARDHLLGYGYVAIAGEAHEPDTTSPTGWRPLAPGRLTAEARHCLFNRWPDRETWPRALVREIEAETVDMARPPGASEVERDRGALVDLDSGEVLGGRLWANRRIEYRQGRITTHRLPRGRLWAGSGSLPWQWTDKPPRHLPGAVADYLSALRIPEEELDYLIGLLGRGLLAANDGGSPIPCLVGGPNSGKSTLLDFIGKVLAGERAAPASVAGLSHRFALSGLVGASMLRLDESDKTRADKGFRAGTAVIIKLSDGQPLQIEAKGRTPYTAHLRGLSVWLAGNAPPLDVESRSDGLGRRVRVFDLPHKFRNDGPAVDLDAFTFEDLATTARHACARWADYWAHTGPPATITGRTRSILDAARPPIDRFLDGYTLKTGSGPGLDLAALRAHYHQEHGEDVTAHSLARAIRTRWPTAVSDRRTIKGRKASVFPLTRTP